MDGDYVKASELLYVNIPKLQKEIEVLNQQAEKVGNSLVRDSVTENEVAEVISKMTGIPLNRLMESEKAKLLGLNEELSKRVKGQQQAVDVVSQAVLRSRAGINDPNRPIGSFLFMGPTGVGKTELARALAAALFDSEKAMIRFDMSEYMEKHSVSKLVGAPPGYVGYENAGLLTEAVRRRPYSVVLFDEIEKAHPDVLNLFLQILDDGQLRDSQGRNVNFKNTIIIMTSNIGSQEALEGNKQASIDEIKKYLRPEFYNRIDEVLVFNALDEKTINQIILKLLNDLSIRLHEQDLNVEFDELIVNDIRKKAYDPTYGARPIKRYIQNHIENFLAEKIVNGDVKKRVPYLVSIDNKNNYLIQEIKKN